MSFHIYINIIDNRFLEASIWKNINSIFKSKNPEWSPGKRSFGIKNRANEDYMLFVLYIAEIYREYLYQVVISREWEKFWVPLSPAYLKQKKKQGFPENIWFRTGDLLDSIEIKYEKSKSRIKIGIDERAVFKVGNRTVKKILVVKWLEFGTVKMPARPLFRRARQQMSKNIGRYKTKFMDLIEPIS